MDYPADFPSQFHASVDSARARARRRFLDKASKLLKTYAYAPQRRKALEDLLKKRVRADVKAFGKEACKAVRLGMWHSYFAEPGMKKFLETSSREAFADAHQISGGSFYYSYPDLELEITTSREWLKCLGEFAKGPQSAVATNAEKASKENTDTRARVDAFLLQCNQESDLKVKLIRTHIWRLAGHKTARQFQYWQAEDDEATDEDERSFGRILDMKPAIFVALLKQKRIIP